jgi:beta-N-acetylhexosaminidase
VIGAAGLGIALLTLDDGSAPRRTFPGASGNGGEGPTSSVSFLQRLIPPAPDRARGPAAPRSVADLAKRLPLERAVAQLFLFGFDGKDATAPVFQELRRLDLGGIVVDSGNYDSPQQLAALAGEASVVGQQTSHVPPWVMAEQDGGELSQFADLPPAQPPGVLKDPKAAATAMGEAVTALKALGINGLFEPPLDVAPSEEAFAPLGDLLLSDVPERVADYGRRVVAQCLALKMFCAAKHFPGLGAASNPTDEGPAQVGLPLSELESRDVVPFRAAIKSGIPGLVISEGLYEPDSFVTPAVLSRKILTDLLRRKLRFGGLAISDDLADPGVSTFASAPDASVQALAAGADMLYISGPLGDQEAAYTAVLNAVRSGKLSQARVREALLRVLLTKRAYGLLR